MQIERDTLVPAPAERVFALVDDLSVYPTWMKLVHDVQEEPARSAWQKSLVRLLSILPLDDEL